MAHDPKEIPVHIRIPDCARSPGEAGENITSTFEDMAIELSRAVQPVGTTHQSEDPCSADVAERGQSFEIRVRLDTAGATADIHNGLLHVRDLLNAEGDKVSLTFTVPDDLEKSLVEASVEDGSLLVVLPRTPETTRVVRQLQRQAN